ncbi:hypothetical protein ACLI08_07125 [Flavobacterium sp. RNTU_13]|uniref:hypothetical protein n=1 Tax=Flavobacterium sp. RNTU_13 TaxID=3375145 RepID=UPI0039872EBE
MKSTIKIVIAACVLSVTGVYAQRKYYIEQNGTLHPTTQASFEKSIDYSKNVDVYMENDTSEIAVLYVRRREGKLDEAKLKQLKVFLQQRSGTIIKDNEYICIHYNCSIPQDSPVLYHDFPLHAERKIQRKLLAITPSQYFRVYNPGGRNNGFRGKHKEAFIADDNKLVLKMFFPTEFNYGNVVVIKPDGTYEAYCGEHTPDEIIDITKRLKNQ